MMQVTIVNIDGKVQEVDFLKLLKENKRTLLYFYPKDNTLGCTTEAKDFSEYRDEFEKKGIKII
jgi:peroxiredoxin Q/BCP